LSLVWNEGNVWKSTIKPFEHFEYKLVLIQKEAVKSWEAGENRSFDLKKIKEILQKLPNMTERNTFSCDGVSYCYNKNSRSLDIVIEWCRK
jgi:hypothetical protein